MSTRQPIALDVMGGDDAPEALVQGALRARERGHEVTLVGSPERIEGCLPRDHGFTIVPAGEVVAMSDAPSSARRMEDASVRVAARLVREGKAAAVVSCGNTGAAMVSARVEIGTMDGVDRPPVSTVLPRSDGGQLVLLDAGANVDCPPERLASFALLGVAHARALGVGSPRVGLLSNGEEVSKGSQVTRVALPLLEALPIDVVGNVEPTGALAGACDVLVCDGFLGNAVLKAAEGAVSMAAVMLMEETRRSPWSQLALWMFRPALRRFERRVSWDTYGGGILLGTEGVFVVGHGRSTPRAVAAAIALAHRSVEGRVTEHVKQALEAVGSVPSQVTGSDPLASPTG